MLKKEYRRLIGAFCMLLFILPIHAQYTVTGGNGTPLLINIDTKFQIYLVYGMDNVEIRYSSASSSHQWFRYKTKALDNSEPVRSIQQGGSSVVQNIEEGYGYYVKEYESIGSNRFIWIIDYSKYAFNIENLRVTSDDACDGFRLSGTADMPEIVYYNPSGIKQELKREFDITYNSLLWSEENKSFSLAPVKESIKGNPFSYHFTKPPLTDTDITLKGDYFSRHFNMEKSISTGSYEAVAIELHLDSTIISIDGENMFFTNEEGKEPGNPNGLSAPAEIRFNVYANEPVATHFEWDIQKEGNPTSLVPKNSGDEVTYTFREAGKYVVQVTVGDRTGKCFKTDSLTIEVGDSYLHVPNAFSPGTSPGVNDIFKVAYKSLVSFKGWIFNRWGVQLFYWTDPTQGWDGKKGGKYVTPGVYFYVIEAKGSDGRNYKMNGHINILRPKNVQDQIIE